MLKMLHLKLLLHLEGIVIDKKLFSRAMKDKKTIKVNEKSILQKIEDDYAKAIRRTQC